MQLGLNDDDVNDDDGYYEADADDYFEDANDYDDVADDYHDEADDYDADVRCRDAPTMYPPDDPPRPSQPWLSDYYDDDNNYHQ